jgi:Phage derived protein Gp49-like (DUF891)
MGSSHDDLKAFPDEPRRDAGFNLDFVQRGLEPQDWKSMNTVGSGVREIRVRDTISRTLFGGPARGCLRAPLFSEENGKDKHTGYRFGQIPI